MNHKVALSFADGKTLFLPVGHDASSSTPPCATASPAAGLPRRGLRHLHGPLRGGSYSLDYADEDTLSAADLEQRKVLACRTRVRSDAAFYFDFASTLCHAAAAQAHSGGGARTAPALRGHSAAPLRRRRRGPPVGLPARPVRACKVPGSDCRRAYSFANRPNPRTTCSSSSACSRAAP